MRNLFGACVTGEAVAKCIIFVLVLLKEVIVTVNTLPVINVRGIYDQKDIFYYRYKWKTKKKETPNFKSNTILKMPEVKISVYWFKIFKIITKMGLYAEIETYIDKTMQAF